MESQSKLVNLIETRLENAKVLSVLRKFFNESKGLDVLKDLCCTGSKIETLQHDNKYYALAACSALFSYIEFAHNKMFLPKSLRLNLDLCYNKSLLQIDSTSIRALELSRSLSGNNRGFTTSKSNLFGVLNYCKTSCGQRLLRSNILRPPSGNVTLFELPILFFLCRPWNNQNSPRSSE